MAATTTSGAWRSRRVAFVQSSTSDHGCRCQVRLMHNGDQASLSLQLQQSTHLAGVSNNPPRHVVLHIQPLIVESCSIAEETSISPLLLKSIPTSSLTSASDVLTVALVLKSPGAVHYPKGLTSVRPTDPADVDFYAFVELCQATTIYIHFARAQFDEQETSKLSALVNGFDSEDLKAPYLNLGREDRGRGLQEGTWQVFSPRVFSPQASGSSHGETSSSLGKRSRQSLGTPSDSHPKRPTYTYTTPPPYSPTEVNTTPTTTSGNSNSIRPTVFTLPPYCKEPGPAKEDGQVTLLANMLATVPEHVLREAVIQSGHERLLGLASAGSALEKPPKLLEPRARRLSSPRITALVRDLFTAEVETRMKYLVEAGLPLQTNAAIEKLMDEYHNVFHHDCENAEAAIQEQVDDASLEVKMALEDGMREIEELVEERLHKLAVEYESFDGKANIEIDNLRCWFVKFAHTLFFEKRAECVSQRDLARCTSI